MPLTVITFEQFCRYFAWEDRMGLLRDVWGGRIKHFIENIEAKLFTTVGQEVVAKTQNKSVEQEKDQLAYLFQALVDCSHPQCGQDC